VCPHQADYSYGDQPCSWKVCSKFARLVGEAVEDPSTVADIGPPFGYGIRFNCWALIYRGPCRYGEIRSVITGKKAYVLCM